MSFSVRWFFSVLLIAGLSPCVKAQEHSQKYSQKCSNDFSYLAPLDIQPWPFVPETPPGHLPPEEPADPLEMDLRPYYEEFEADGIVTVYLGYGIGTYYPARGRQIFEMLRLLNERHPLSLRDWKITNDGSRIAFRDARGIRYQIQIGYERSEFMRAFSKYEIVMYHGHSRYGQGPAFQSYQNYFRIGRNFETIEVDARNATFREEPILKTEFFPVQRADLPTGPVLFQYRGQKDFRSKLPDTSYTKIIPGGDLDWRNTSFLPGRQLFYLYSCTNRPYWRQSIRELHPDAARKFIFGTYKNGRGRTEPDALMIFSLVARKRKSTTILNILNTTKDCDRCFTSY